MSLNEVFNSLCSTFNFNDTKIIAIFALGDLKVDCGLINKWITNEDDPEYRVCKDAELSCFLDGLITDKRGKKEGAQPIPVQKISNNMVLKKLKIALDLKSEDLIDIFKLADFNLSKHELTAFFRRPEHKNYRKCKNQVLRDFLKGLQIKFSPTL